MLKDLVDRVNFIKCELKSLKNTWSASYEERLSNLEAVKYTEVCLRNARARLYAVRSKLKRIEYYWESFEDLPTDEDYDKARENKYDRSADPSYDL